MSATDQADADDATVRGEATEEEQRATEAARSAAELTTRNDFLIPARHSWDKSQVEVIRRTVAKDCNRDELAMFLEVASRYQLDPFLRELFAAKFDGQHGAVTIFAGRDGLLKAAKLTGRFRHMESHVVREKDEYEVIVDTDAMRTDEESGVRLGRLRKLRHVRKGMGSAQRGPIVGSYALVFLRGDEEPWFAEATWEDYGQTKQSTRSGKDTNWTVGKGYTEAMMVKVAQSIALRMGCGLAGIYAQEEVQKKLDDAGRQDLSGSGEGEHKTPGVQWPEGEVGVTLQVLVDRANELVKGSWRPAKVAMRVNGQSEEQLLAFASELRRFIAGRAPEDPLGVEPERVTDADVVAEPEPITGEVAQSLVDQMHDDEQVRGLVQERLAEVEAAVVAGDDAVRELGFPGLDEAAAEVERLAAALRDATNGGPTVAEEMEHEAEPPAGTPEEPQPGEVDGDEPDAAGDTLPEPEEVDGEPVPEGVEWNDDAAAEYAELEHVVADLETALEDATGEAERILTSNLADARTRFTALRKAKAAAERGS